MLTTDPIYKKPLLPVITVKNTANTSTLYSYNSFTKLPSVITSVNPLFCSVSLSKNTFGTFSIQFHDPNIAMKDVVTVGSRVIIDCGKQSGITTRLISGLIRKKGYSRGHNNKILYNVTGTSTGIRLNELITYIKSEAAKLPDGITLDLTDVTRKADTLLATLLSNLTADGILSIANLAANSDVETFIANLLVEYGELQDGVSYIEEQSGGEVVIDTNDLVNFQYEIKNTLFGRGFTIKNSTANQGNDDADDTMYLRGKAWSYDDDFYKSSAFANRLYAILQAQNRPSDRSELGYTVSPLTLDSTKNNTQIAVKFKPTHTRHFANDFMYVGGLYDTSVATNGAFSQNILICKDSGGLPLNSNGIVAIVQFNGDQFQSPVPNSASDETYQIHTGDQIYNSLTGTVGETYLDTTQSYWMIWERTSGASTTRLLLGKNSVATGSNYRYNTGPNYATPINGGSSWSALNPGTVAIAVGRYRSHSLVMWDPKSVQAISSGLTAGQYVDAPLTDISAQITTFESMYRHLANQMYLTPKPRTVYNFPKVSCPNIPPFPGDTIVISDTILGLSTLNNSVVLTTFGDITYSWGNMDSGKYNGPTNLSLQCVGVHPRYR